MNRSLVAHSHTVVVGGGIAGLSTAFSLLQNGGIEVTLVEKANEIAQGASAKNGGLLCPSLDYPWTSNRIIDFTSDDGILPNAIVSPEKSPMRFKPSSITNPSVIDFGLQWMGRQQNSQPIRQLMEYSMGLYQSEPLSSLNFDQGFAKGTMVDGIVDERDSSGDIFKFCRELRSLMVNKHGTEGGTGRLRIRTNQKIEQVVVAGDKVVELRMPNGNRMFGDSFVVAAGTGSRNIVKSVGVPCPTVPVKGYLLTFSSPTQVTSNIKLPSRMFVAPIGISEEDGRFIYRCSGLAEFGGSKMGIDWEGKEKVIGKSDREALDQMRGTISETFQDVQVTDEDYGFRCLAPDDVPLIGRTKYNNLYLNTGHGSKGWTMGAGSGKLCAQIVLGMETDIEANWYDPSRFDQGLLRRSMGPIMSPRTTTVKPVVKLSFQSVQM